MSDGTVKEYFYDRKALAERKRAVRDGHALHKLGLGFMASPEYARLSAPWRRTMRNHIAEIADELGWVGMSDLSDRSIRQEFYRLRDRFKATPHKADQVIAVLHRLLSWAYERGEIDVNHAARIERLGESATRADKIWLPANEKAFLDAASPEMAAFFRVALYTALRQGDICGLRWTDFDGRWLVVTPSKTAHSTKVKVHLPVYTLPPLADVLAGLPRKADWMLLTRTDRQWNPPKLRSAWRTTEKRAGIDRLDLHFHDLRGTAVTRMLEAGCTDAEVAAITGHAMGSRTSLGTYAARTRDLAVAAYRKWARKMASGKRKSNGDK